MNGLWPWVAVAMLGAYHGIDPSMGWLFAVALGLQERRRTKVVAALFPIAIGHLLSVALIVASIALVMKPAPGLVRPVGAAALIAFGLFRFWRPRTHPRWVAMRVNSIELAAWSFLMATAHGAGLMLIPALMPLQEHAEHMHAMPVAGSIWIAGLAVAVHTIAMLTVTGIVALLVYDFRGWVNLDLIWAAALIAMGLLLLLT